MRTLIHAIFGHRLCMLLSLTLLCLHIFCGTDTTRGTETTNENVFTVYRPDGITPAPDVYVAFMPKGSDNTGIADTVISDQQGNFSVPENLEQGTWTITFTPVADEPYAAWQEVAITDKDTHSIQSDTLEPAGKISGIVALKPSDRHLLNAVSVQLLGTTRIVNADKEGRFTLSRIPTGFFTIRCQVPPQMSEYGYLDTELDRTNGRDTLLTDTLFLPYLGIPEVTGLKADFDSLTGIVHLQWDTVSNKFDAMILRRMKGSTSQTIDTISVTGDSFFYDHLFADTVEKPLNVKDTTPSQLEYGVVLRNSNDSTGRINEWEDVRVISPYIFRTYFNTTSRSASNGMKSRITDKSDGFIIETTCTNNRIPIAALVYSEMNNDSVLVRSGFSPPAVEVNDATSLSFPPDTPFKLVISAVDSTGHPIPFSSDTLTLLICETLIIGDTNADSKIDALDALAVSNHLNETQNGTYIFNERERLIADVNQDTYISIHDAYLISCSYANIPITFPICGNIGDVNLDGVIDSIDKDLVIDHLDGIIQLDRIERIFADVNGDNTVSSLDVTLFARYYANEITEFPFEKK